MKQGRIDPNHDYLSEMTEVEDFVFSTTENAMSIQEFLRSIGCRTSLNQTMILDEFANGYYLWFDCNFDPEDEESLETCDIYVVDIPKESRVRLIKNASPADVVQFMLSLKSARYSGTTLRALQAEARRTNAVPDLIEAIEGIFAITDRNHVAWDKAHAAIAKAKG